MARPIIPAPPLMAQVAAPTLDRPLTPAPLLRVVLALAAPALFEQVFTFLVGLNDTWLANNLPKDVAPAATAAVGTISYLLWFIGLIVSAVGTGSTALISRARGARHRRLINGVWGQRGSGGRVGGVGVGGGVWGWGAGGGRVWGGLGKGG